MGMYINRNKDGSPLPMRGKAEKLAAQVPLVEIFLSDLRPFPDTSDFAVLCEDGFALGYMFNEREFESFADPTDTRPKRFFITTEIDIIKELL